MNRQQKDYALAKAAYQAAKDTIADYERDWIIAEGIKSEDGTTPTRLSAIDCPEAQFDVYCSALESRADYMELCAMETVAYKALVSAENALIDYALSIAPAGIRETLNAHRKELKVREKLLDLAFRLDTRTVK